MHAVYMEHRYDADARASASHGVFFSSAAGADILLTTPPGADASLVQYRALGGTLPQRRSTHTARSLPDDSVYALPKKGSGTQEVATTMAFVRLLKDLLRTKDFGHRIVPIIPDEARTFGMDAYFPTANTFEGLLGDLYSSSVANPTFSVSQHVH